MPNLSPYIDLAILLAYVFGLLLSMPLLLIAAPILGAVYYGLKLWYPLRKRD